MRKGYFFNLASFCSFVVCCSWFLLLLLFAFGLSKEPKPRSRLSKLATVLKKTKISSYVIEKLATVLKKNKKTRFQKELLEPRSTATLSRNFGVLGFFQ